MPHHDPRKPSRLRHALYVGRVEFGCRPRWSFHQEAFATGLLGYLEVIDTIIPSGPRDQTTRPLDCCRRKHGRRNRPGSSGQECKQ
jgi:hypothetical protein